MNTEELIEVVLPGKVEPLLLKTIMEAGHGGASGRFERLREIALTQAFAITLMAGRS